MSNLFFENQGNNTFLEYRIAAEDQIDTMSLGMLTNNDIPGLAATSFTQMDMDRFIKFNVSAKVSVTQLFSGAVNKKRLLGVFTGIIDAMLSAEDYMLDPNSLLLDLDYIFTDVSSCETELICLPLLNVDNKNPDLNIFFKNIVFTTQFDQTENCDHVAQILNYLNSNPMLSLAGFKELLTSLSHGPQPVQAQQPKVAVPASAPAPAPAQPVRQPKAPRQTPVQEKPQMQAPVSVPVKQPDPAPVAAVSSAEDGDKPMSMFYLLQHYNKENAALYKAQQESKKAKKDPAPAAPVAPAPVPAQPKPPVKQSDPGFAVPGQQPVANPGFAVPGQQPSVPAAPKAPAPKAPAVPAPAPAGADTCAKCGNPMRPNQAFCTSCGTRRATAAAQPAVQQPVVQQASPLNFGETTVLSGGIGETTVLTAVADNSQADVHLIRTKNNEKIPLNKPVFRIGKERSYVDYFVGDNTAISRSHANIINRNGEYFVVDTNSTNHTYVNGGMIPSNVETQLTHGAKIRLANEEFEFKMY